MSAILKASSTQAQRQKVLQASSCQCQCLGWPSSPYSPVKQKRNHNSVAQRFRGTVRHTHAGIQTTSSTPSTQEISMTQFLFGYAQKVSQQPACLLLPCKYKYSSHPISRCLSSKVTYSTVCSPLSPCIRCIDSFMDERWHAELRSCSGNRILKHLCAGNSPFQLLTHCGLLPLLIITRGSVCARTQSKISMGTSCLVHQNKFMMQMWGILQELAFLQRPLTAEYSLQVCADMEAKGIQLIPQGHGC